MKRILITCIVHGLFKKVVFLGSRFILKKLLIHAHFMPACKWCLCWIACAISSSDQTCSSVMSLEFSLCLLPNYVSLLEKVHVCLFFFHFQFICVLLLIFVLSLFIKVFYIFNLILKLQFAIYYFFFDLVFIILISIFFSWLFC